MNPKALNDLMQFDHVIQVDADGNVSDAPGDIWAPEVYDDSVDQEGGWSLMDGYSGQCGYSGPEMHPSELIGDSLAEAILKTPGYYVAVTVNEPDDEEAPTGWAVAFKEAS